MYISGIWGGGQNPLGGLSQNFFLEEYIPDVITCFKFGDDRFGGLASAEGQILPFPIDFDGRPYNTLTLPCERVISSDYRLQSEFYNHKFHKSQRGIVDLISVRFGRAALLTYFQVRESLL